MVIDAGSEVIYTFELISNYFKSLPNVECTSVVSKLLNYCKKNVLEPFYSDKLSKSSVSHFWSYVSRVSGVSFSVCGLEFLLDEVLYMDNLSIFLRDLEESLPVNLSLPLVSVNHDLTNFLSAD